MSVGPLGETLARCRSAAAFRPRYETRLELCFLGHNEHRLPLGMVPYDQSMITRAGALLFAVLLVGAACAGDSGTATLTVNPECSNAGAVEAGGSTYYVIGPAPAEWRETGRIVGELTITDRGATFTSGGHTVEMSKDHFDAECTFWPSPEDP